jgi:hypothetical protein
MDSHELHDRLLEDARQYDPGRHTRSLLAPYRDVLLLQRAKFMSYEQISATLTRHGLNISGPAVGCFCRQQFTKREIDAMRRSMNLPKPAASLSTLPPAMQPSIEPGKRGPKIARKDF